ncbi:hypothetical protein ACIRRA_39365 [Nocardia sp. NPDC101769]|uniref:hypothetical protein n=1 Tax=Nocardia sp. NPDC101769 TaxID=3364333 RepID=UPI0038201FFF
MKNRNIGPVAQKWVDDGCEQGYISNLCRRRAEGIAKIHATCTPPCPRVTTAREYLDQHPEPTPNGETR